MQFAKTNNPDLYNYKIKHCGNCNCNCNCVSVPLNASPTGITTSVVNSPLFTKYLPENFSKLFRDTFNNKAGVYCFIMNNQVVSFILVQLRI